MYIKREFESKLINELENYEKPICILGARQTGKTTMIKKVVEEEDYVYINLFESSFSNKIFNQGKSLNVDDIVKKIELYYDKKITNDTIIIIDEIQTSADALSSLKSFNEDGRFKVIVSGSNLGSHIFLNSNRSFPVGQIKIFNLYPLSFSEFLCALELENLNNYLISNCHDFDFDDVIHEKLLYYFDIFMIVGSMPEVVKKYIETKDVDELDFIKQNLVDGYRYDFAKYEKTIGNTKAMISIYNSIPYFLNKENQKFIFSEINYEFRQLDHSFTWLSDNNYIDKVGIINAINLPLSQYASDNKFKVFLNETSLLVKLADYDIKEIIRENDKTYYGFVIENYASNILKKHFSYVYNYKKNKLEIDFVTSKKGKVYAFEIKSGTNTNSKSLDVFAKNNPDVHSFKVSRKKVSNNKHLNIPIYALDIYFK